MRFSDVVGHARAVAWLRRALASGRAGGAYLFYGPPGVGKGTLALAFAAALTCPHRTDEQEACGRCGGCRAAARGQHPDITWIEPHSEAGNVTIEQIRDLRAHLSLSAGASGWKVAIIDRAERMTLQAANALLKTLEEPAGQAVLVLLAGELALVPETIQSRCLRFYLAPVPVSDLVRELEARLGLPPEEARARAALAGGCPGRALAGMEGVTARRKAALGWMQEALDAPAREVDRLAKAADQADLAQVDETLSAMIWLWRDVAAWSWTKRPDLMINSDLRDHLAPIGQKVAPEKAVSALEALLGARRMVSEYTSRRLTLNWAWMTLRSALQAKEVPVTPGARSG